MGQVPQHGQSAFFKYVSPEALVAILRDRRLRWSSPNTLNDHFDMQHNIRLDVGMSEIGEALKQEVTQMLYGPIEPTGDSTHLLLAGIRLLRRVAQRIPKEQWDRDMEEVIKSSMKSSEEALNWAANDWRQWVHTLRVFCVSESKTDPLMWAHYASAHRGAVIKFNCIPELDTALCAALPVKYADQMPVFAKKEEWVKHMTGQSRIDFRERYRDFVCLKSTEWAHEKEWRGILQSRFPSQPFELNPFFPEELGEIHFGERASTELVNQAKSLAVGKYPNVQFFRAKRLDGEYGLEFTAI